MRKKSEPSHRQIAPKLLSGDSRISFGHGLPESVKAGLFAIARAEGKSVSWVLECVIIDYFRLERPEYKRRAGERTAKPVHIPRKIEPF